MVEAARFPHKSHKSLCHHVTYPIKLKLKRTDGMSSDNELCDQRKTNRLEKKKPNYSQTLQTAKKKPHGTSALLELAVGEII